MFIPIPVHIRDGQKLDSYPLANTVLIAINVLVFWWGWHPWVGTGSSPLTILTYAFGHADVWHLAANMFTLLIFGTAVNRRVGNEWYLVIYLGSSCALGLFVWLFVPGHFLGASGAIFAVIAVALLLLPSARIDIAYFALFPTTLLVGLLHAPHQPAGWFIRWDRFLMRAWWGLFLVPLLELWGLIAVGWNWTNLGHLLGLLFGILAVLLLPTRITLNRRWSAA